MLSFHIRKADDAGNYAEMVANSEIQIRDSMQALCLLKLNVAVCLRRQADGAGNYAEMPVLVYYIMS